jgi:creatinine amidohydrolase
MEKVRYADMLPHEIVARRKRFPAAFIGLGGLEWHGEHLAVGNDALKAHGILVKCAEQFGGVVYPPQWLHSGFDRDHLVPVYTELFTRLKKTGFRVIIGVSGHNVEQQIEMINAALEPVTADGTCAGTGIWEITLSRCEESNTDHAAKWETSNMMLFYPDRVDIDELGEGELKLDMSAPDGIGGLDPREHASEEVGRRNVELAASAIGQKAQELLESLPEEHREFSLEKIEPGHWWMV